MKTDQTEEKKEEGLREEWVDVSQSFQIEFIDFDYSF